MVAAAGERGVLSPSAARYLLLALAAALGLAIVLMPRANIGAFVGIDKPPDALRERARDILQSIGIEKPVDSASWFRSDRAFFEWARTHGGLAKDLSRDAVAFVYRQSASALVPWLDTTGPFPAPLVSSTNPAPLKPGMSEVWVDPRGRLVRLEIVAPEFRTGAAPSAPTDWNPLFREAGLDMSRFTAVPPEWSPRGFATERAAWQGPHPERPGVTMRIEAASYAGRPISYRWIGPWVEPAQPTAASLTSSNGELIFEIILFLCIVVGAILVRRNIRSGRSDRRGGLRLAAATGSLTLLMWIVGGHHVRNADEGWLFLEAFSNAAGTGLIYWILYVALEPFARRRWPQMLISWQRALSGRWRDPLVGRDVLIGAVVGTFGLLLLGPARVLIPMKLGVPGVLPYPLGEDAPVSVGATIAWFITAPLTAVFIVLGIVFFLILARRIVRVGWLAAIIVTLLFAAQYVDPSLPVLTWVPALLYVAGLVFTTVRFGVLSGIVAQASMLAIGLTFRSNDPSNWMFFALMIATAAIAALAWWATKTALAGQPLFGGEALEA